MTLSRLLFSFVSRHWRSYILAALMLATVAVLTVMIPRQVGHIVDALVAHKLSGDALLEQLAWLLGMGLAIYFLRVGWRLQLFSCCRFPSWPGPSPASPNTSTITGTRR
ncbi:hypothetical protein [Chromobacterium amazonense]|uniref:hypothetical protein n=1 Tax=Chromobacterium amazonense TaxID=1382803 RepID=UPI0030B91BA0